MKSLVCAIILSIDDGDIAQQGERCVRIAEVGGSNPPISTIVDGIKDYTKVLKHKPALKPGTSCAVVGIR